MSGFIGPRYYHGYHGRYRHGHHHHHYGIGRGLLWGLLIGPLLFRKLLLRGPGYRRSWGWDRSGRGPNYV